MLKFQYSVQLLEVTEDIILNLHHAVIWFNSATYVQPISKGSPAAPAALIMGVSSTLLL